MVTESSEGKTTLNTAVLTTDLLLMLSRRRDVSNVSSYHDITMKKYVALTSKMPL